MYGDVLFAIHSERSGRRQDARISGRFPEKLAGGGVEGMNLTIVGSTAKDDIAGRYQHGAPVRAGGIVVLPYLFARVDVPGLHLAEVIGARAYAHRRDVHSVVPAARHIFYFGAFR